MNFHEYQAKALFTEYGIPVPAGRIATTIDQAAEAARAIGGEQWVVKAQIHAGGRGKAGGVKLVRDIDGVKDAIMRAVEMKPGEQGRRMRALRKKVREHDVEDWSQDFLAALADAKERAK